MRKKVRAVTRVPLLSAVTRTLVETPDLVALADRADPVVWLRGDRGCVGLGEVLRLRFSGEHRFAAASRSWARIAAAARVDDSVRLPGSGLVALGAFAFADTSEAESVLVVPRMIVARHRGAAWVTEISLSGEGEDLLSDPSAPGGPTCETGAGPAIPDDLVVRRDGSRVLSVTRGRPEAGAWPGAVLHTDPRCGDDPDPASTGAYLDGVAEAGRRIARGEVEKIVLSRQVRGGIAADADLRVPLGRLAETYLDCWTYAIDGLVGASPETLIRSTDGAVSGRVLAGTRARRPGDAAADERARDDLLTSAKEQHEHAFAVQSVVTALAPHVVGLHTSEEPFALKLPNVWHLATDLGAHLSGRAGPAASREQAAAGGAAGGARATALDLVGALHPTAAVAGTPTAAAVAAIDELEPFDRGRYAGAVGWIDAAGDGEWVIALRCAQLGSVAASTSPPPPRSVTATAGGGIVEGSDPAHELGETVSKFRPITDAFA